MNSTTYRDEHGKVCTKCGEYKLYDQYYRNRNVKDGKASECKACNYDANRKTPSHKGSQKRALDAKRKSLRTYTDRVFYTYRVSKEEAARLAVVPACECCGAVLGGDGGRTRHVDHSYATGKVRGVLCAQCNTGLGKLGDSASGVERAAQYLAGSVDALSMAEAGHTYLPDYV